MLKELINKELETPRKKIPLMTHIICGYPSFEANWEILEVMDENNVDIVELQFPFSEPIADGPLFAFANQESLNNGTTIQQCFDFMKKVTDRFSFEVVMMGYYNTVFKQGESAFCQKLKEAGAKGLIIPDLPIEEAEGLEIAAKETGLSLVPLVTPTSTTERIQQIAKRYNDSESVLYAVARKGVTGKETSFGDELNSYLATLRKEFKIPVGVGFGVKSSEDLDFIKSQADYAIIGTAVLKSYLDKGIEGVKTFFSDLKL